MCKKRDRELALDILAIHEVPYADMILYIADHFPKAIIKAVDKLKKKERRCTSMKYA